MSKETEDFLAHHGVLGMKWGQHLSGRGGIKVPRQVKAPKRTELHPDHIERVNLARNKSRSLSTVELKKLNDRLQTEQQYKRLNPSVGSRGKAALAALLGTTALGVTAYKQIKSPAGKAAIAGGKKAFNKVLDKYAVDFSGMVIGSI